MVEALGRDIAHRYLKRLFLVMCGMYMVFVVPAYLLFGFFGFFVSLGLVLGLGYVLLDDFAGSGGERAGHLRFVWFWWVWVLLGFVVLSVLYILRFL